MKAGFCPALASSGPVCPGIALLLAPCLAARPLPPDYGLGDGAKPPENRQNLPVDAFHQLWQDGPGMNESEKQFSFTRAAPSTSGRAKNQIPTSDTPHGFCDTCLSQTTWESPGDTGTLNFVVGLKLLGNSDGCPVCRSIVQRVYLLCFIPIIPLWQYRVIYFEKGWFSSKYIGRRLLTARDARRPPDPGGERLKRFHNRLYVTALIVGLVVLSLLFWLTSL